jgi:NADPH:quinone reductase-like Zn-dependent oxidoreductase
MFRRGMYLEAPTFPSRIGYEAAGTIAALGPDVTEFKVGERVSTVPAFSMTKYGSYGEEILAPVYAVARYPENLSPEQGTSIWMQYLTAWGGLVHYGKIKQHDFAVITAASSSVGLAAIEIAKLEGASSIAVTRGSAKKDALLKAGADFVVATNEENLAARVQEITSGKGFQIAFDPIGGKMLPSLGEAAGRGALIVEYGALATETTPYPLFAALAKGLLVRGYTLFEFAQIPELLKVGVQYAYEHLKAGRLNPKIAKTFKFSEIVEAHKYMESNEQIGKIVVTV